MEYYAIEQQSPLQRRLRHHGAQQNSLGGNCEKSEHDKGANFRKLNDKKLGVRIREGCHDMHFEV